MRRLLRITLAAAVATALLVSPASLGGAATAKSRAAGATSPVVAAVASPRASATGSASAAPARRSVPHAGPADIGRVIVKYRPGVTAAQRAALGTAGATPVGRSGLVAKAAPAGMTAAQYAAKLSDSPLVAYAEPDYLMRPATVYTSTPNDPHFNDATSYHFSAGSGSIETTIEHARSWDLRGALSPNFDMVWPALASADATPGQVHVAVIDTGFYFSHPDARTSNIHAAIDECATYDPVTSEMTTDTNCEPVDPATPGNDVETAAHGTMTAGEIGAAPNNSVGSLGAGYDAWVDIYKVMGVASRNLVANGVVVIKAGEAVMPESALISAIDDAVAAATAGHYRLVISISLELIAPDANLVQGLNASIANARAHNVVVVAASGNEGRATVSYPAASPGVIAVGAYGAGSGIVWRSSYSNYGSALDLLAPGDHIWGPTKPDSYTYSPGDLVPVFGYDWWTGTSMATPLAASAASLLLRVEPTLSAAEVASYLASGTVDMGAKGWDSATGWGRLDAYRSYYLLAAPRTTANVKARYGGTAVIDFTVTDRDSGSAVTTFYKLDTDDVVSGTRVQSSVEGTHTLRYWSVDINGVAEAAHTATFAVLPPDTTPPVTTSNAVGSYYGTAGVRLSAVDTGTDAWGVAQTLYRLDGATAKSGTSVGTGKYGTHTLLFWSVDQAGNVETSHTVTFSVKKRTPALTLSRSASTIYRNHTVKLSGSLTPARVGDYVRLQFRYPGSSTWHYLTSSYARRISTVGSSGKGSFASLTAKLTRHGRYYFRAYFPGDSTYISRTSRYSSTVSVYVR